MAGKTLASEDKKVHVAEIVNYGDKIILPELMELPDAISVLQRRMEYLGEEVRFSESFNVFPWDGANALNQVLIKRYGWSPQERTPGFFGSKPPSMITIETGYKTTTQIPWGRFSLPSVTGYLETSYNQKEGRLVFELHAVVLRKDEKNIKALLDELRAELKSRSIYRGKAFKMRFRDDRGATLQMPEPRFINTQDISRDQLIYSKEVQDAIETNLFTPIERLEDCVANGIPVKRGVLLGGPYGTGKTLAAKVASQLAELHGITYIYVQRADELADAVSFSKQYNDPGCVIFCEDIDRAMDGARTEAMDDILNIIDGIDTKSNPTIVVLTTNHLDNINPAMLRPGRLDAVIDVLPPDADAVEKLIRYYGGTAIDANEDLTTAKEKLAGRIPAVIAEVVKRAKLSQLRLQERGTKVTKISCAAIVDAAFTMTAQLDLLYKDRNPPQPSVDGILQKIVAGVVDNKLEVLQKQVAEIHDSTT